MFEAIATSKTLRSLIDPVARLVDECTVRIDDEGLSIRAVDPSNVGMVDISLGAAAFESFETDGATIGVNLSRFQDIVKMANARQNVHLQLDEDDRTLAVAFGGLEYSLALIDPDSIRDEPDIPDLELSAEVVVDAGHINQAIRAGDMISDHLVLGVDEGADTFYVEAEGETDDIHFELDKDDLVALEAGEAESLFSLEYLMDMNRAIPKSAEVTIELGAAYPTKLHFDVADGHGAATYMLAPRIQS